MLKVGDEVVCSARWVYGWHAIVIEIGNGAAKVRWNDKSVGESWVEIEYLTRKDGEHE